MYTYTPLYKCSTTRITQLAFRDPAAMLFGVYIYIYIRRSAVRTHISTHNVRAIMHVGYVYAEPHTSIYIYSHAPDLSCGVPVGTIEPTWLYIYIYTPWFGRVGSLYTVDRVPQYFLGLLLLCSSPQCRCAVAQHPLGSPANGGVVTIRRPLWLGYKHDCDASSQCAPDSHIRT
jgi:hypothetical protein